MPKKNFETVGVLQRFTYVKGVIKERILQGDSEHAESEWDTCTVEIKGHEHSKVPVFYHCRREEGDPEIEVLDNGSLKNAASAFPEDDEVVVLQDLLDNTYVVISHIGEKRECLSTITVAAYQEYTDIPVTWDNCSDYENGGNIRVFSAVDSGGGVWTQGTLLHDTRSDSCGSEGTRVFDGTTWTYTECDEALWKMKFDTTTNQWTFNISGDYISPSGKYIVFARFYRNSISTYYPRNYSDEAYEPVSPGSYMMSVPYYKTEYTSEFNNISLGCTRFGTGLTAVNGETKTAIRTVWATVPIKLTAGLSKTACCGTYSYYTEPWSQPESYLISYRVWGYRCTSPYPAGTYIWIDFFSLPLDHYGTTDNGTTHIDEGVLTTSADIEFYNGEDVTSLTHRESHWKSATEHNIVDMGTFTVGEHSYQSDWINPPAPVTREGLPPYRALKESEAYVKATYNEVTGIPWYAPNTEWGVTCYNTAESRTISMLVRPSVTFAYL
jgi:hypothetical protein